MGLEKRSNALDAALQSAFHCRQHLNRQLQIRRPRTQSSATIVASRSERKLRFAPIAACGNQESVADVATTLTMTPSLPMPAGKNWLPGCAASLSVVLVFTSSYSVITARALLCSVRLS